MVKRKDFLILIILFAIIVYWSLQLIFGGSPELSELNLALIVAIIGVLLGFYKESVKVRFEMRYLRDNIKMSFFKMKEDMSELKSDIGQIKKKLKIY